MKVVSSNTTHRLLEQARYAKAKQQQQPPADNAQPPNNEGGAGDNNNNNGGGGNGDGDAGAGIVAAVEPDLADGMEIHRFDFGAIGADHPGGHGRGPRERDQHMGEIAADAAPLHEGVERRGARPARRHRGSGE